MQRGKTEVERFGEILKARREELGISLEEVEAETKIRKFYLTALENNGFDQLPAKVYAVGFVKQYSRLLKLDEIEMVNRFKINAFRQEMTNEENENQEAPEKIRLPGPKIPVRNIIAAAAFLVVAVWLGVALVDYLSSHPAQNNSAPKTSQKAPNTTTKPPQSQHPPAVTGVHLVIKAQGRCWIGATVDGNPIPGSTIYAGEEKKIDAQEKIHLVLGNPGVVTVEYNGKDLGSIGDPKRVLRTDFPPSNDNNANSTTEQVNP
jgi:cytoskeletal protein RodZ